MGLFGKLFSKPFKKVAAPALAKKSGGKLKFTEDQLRQFGESAAKTVGKVGAAGALATGAVLAAPAIAGTVGAKGAAGTAGGSGIFGKIGGALKKVKPLDAIQAGLGGLSAIESAKAAGRSRGLQEEALGLARSEYASRAPLRDAALRGILTPTTGTDLSDTFAGSSNPFARPVRSLPVGNLPADLGPAVAPTVGPPVGFRPVLPPRTKMGIRRRLR